MKKKLVSKWLHCLPLLFLALILGVMPLTMAAPAHADVLSGGFSYWQVSLDGLSMYGSESASNYVFFVSGTPGNFIGGYLFSDDPISIELTGGNFVVRASSLFLVSRNIFDQYFSVVDLRGVYVWPYTDGVYTITNFVGGSVRGDVSLPTGIMLPSVQFERFGSIGVLDTFTGVGTWLSGAVHNISTMFWTAESGMTVLGYLAVASLALAVILLIFYLIAGWLKFH